MNLSPYISQLLFKHDCVIIPGFGGFVTEYSSAKVHPINHSFNPPSKSILFNSKITRNDGLLIHSISMQTEQSYEEIKKDIEIIARDFRYKIEQKEKIHFDNIGTLTNDGRDNILFESESTINFLEDSSYLPTFVSPPIIRQPVHKRIERTFSDRKPVPITTEKSKQIHIAYYAIIPVLFIVGWFAFNTDLLNKNTQKSGILNIPEQSEINKSSGETDFTNEPIEAKPIRELSFADSDYKIEKVSKTLNEDLHQPEQKVILPKYYIIGGAFMYEENATKLIASLRNKGYNAEAAGTNPDGLHMVSYFVTVDKSEALLNLSMIKKEDNQSAWLLKK